MKKSLLAVVLMLAGVVHAQQHPLFKDADHALGEKLIADNKCEECHKRRAGGDGSDIYNPKGRIKELFKERDPIYQASAHFVIETSRPRIPTMVTMIVSQLELAGLLPMESAA